jgi:hypothetical protein
MSLSRNWQFTIPQVENIQSVILKKIKNNLLENVTFLQLSKNKGLVVLKKQTRQSVVRKLLGVTNIIPVCSAKKIRDEMENVTFSYGKILNKHEKKLANKSTNYSEIVREFSKTALVPEDDPRFDTVYNIISSADTVEDGMLKIYEDLPSHKTLIHPALQRYKLKKSQLDYNKKVEESKYIVWNDWQQQLELELQTSPDPRKIIWYYDPIGNTGKTFFAKWKYQLDKFTAIVLGGEAKNIYHILSKRTENTNTIIIDMSRACQHLVDYALIENLKNGYFQSGKYDSKMIVIPIPHLVIFSNFQPNISQLSLDRWEVRRLAKNGDKINIYKDVLKDGTISDIIKTYGC